MEKEKKSLLSSYLTAKDAHRDSVVMYQVGGFYQMFYHDALLVSRELELKLLSRSMGGGEQAPMCGVPAAAVRQHAQRLADLGYRVALFPQRRTEGQCHRELAEVIEPTGEVHDLTEEWEGFFKDPPAVPQPQRHRKRKEEKLLTRLRGLDLTLMTPMQALETLYAWQKAYIKDGNV